MLMTSLARDASALGSIKVEVERLVHMKDPQLTHDSSPSTYKSRHKRRSNNAKDSTVHTTEYFRFIVTGLLNFELYAMEQKTSIS